MTDSPPVPQPCPECGGGWLSIASAPKDGTPILVARHMGQSWGWVRGWARYSIAGGIGGWISYGFADPPGELGLAHPTHWRPIPACAGTGSIDCKEEEGCPDQ